MEDAAAPFGTLPDLLHELCGTGGLLSALTNADGTVWRRGLN
jgi:hypothetical protein